MPKPKKKGSKKVKPTFHVFCEGENTEPDYITGFRSYYYSDKRSIIIVEDTNKNTPVQLVEKAIEQREEALKKGLENNIFWVVFDRESVAKYKHTLHIKASELANKNKINIAISTICFEYWLLLHFKYTTPTHEKCDNVWKNSIFKKLLEQYNIAIYSKKKRGTNDLFNEFHPHLYKAIEYAERANLHALKSAKRGKENPTFLGAYTNVHELLIDIKQFVDMDEVYEKNNLKVIDTINSIKILNKTKNIKEINQNQNLRKEFIKEMVMFFKP